MKPDINDIEFRLRATSAPSIKLSREEILEVVSYTKALESKLKFLLDNADFYHGAIERRWGEGNADLDFIDIDEEWRELLQYPKPVKSSIEVSDNPKDYDSRAHFNSRHDD